MDIIMRARDIPPDLLEFFEPVATDGMPNHIRWAPEPLQAAHYAAYPRWLPRLAIQAGTSERGVCPDCGAPHLRIVGGTRYEPPLVPVGVRNVDESRGDKTRKLSGADYNEQVTRTTLGWRQSCRCPVHSPVPSTVLDPFSGSGTTLIEANALGRHGIGVELQEKYVDIAHKRLSGQPLSLFAHEGAAEFAGAAPEAAG